MARVHIWSYDGYRDAWGHASMTLSDGTHISWWPSNQRKQDLPFLPQVYTAPANDPQTFEMDIALEGNVNPDMSIEINLLNEKNKRFVV
jgi:hypothetical protein